MSDFSEMAKQGEEGANRRDSTHQPSSGLKDTSDSALVTNPWRTLRHYTDARIGLGRAGGSLPTREQLAFQLDHAEARDAVHLPLDTEQLMAKLSARFPLILRLHSAASDRSEYLRRPDLGRQLDQESKDQLTQLEIEESDISICIVDGLSARAIHEQAIPFIDELQPALKEMGLSIGPICLVEQGRVAVGDPVGEALKARMSIVLIGERPGLSSPDSLGVYFTWNPHSGCMDSQRNCISNVRPRGLSFTGATKLLTYLIREALILKASGVLLKDDSETESELGDGHQGNFLLP